MCYVEVCLLVDSVFCFSCGLMSVSSLWFVGNVCVEWASDMKTVKKKEDMESCSNDYECREEYLILNHNFKNYTIDIKKKDLHIWKSWKIL